MHFKLSIFRAAIFLALCIPVQLIPATANAQNDSTPQIREFTEQQLEFFETKVRPILVEQCFDCHGPDSKPIEGGLNLSSRKLIINGGDTGAAISPGHPDKSLLIDAINYGEIYEMPPDTKMSDKDIEILTQWVSEGAAWPEEADVAVDAKETFDIAKRKSEHWAWKPPKKQKPPIVKNDAWPKNSIDHFILRNIEEVGLTPAPAADKTSLIRRAYFDLIGMPPNREQIEAFINDPEDNAFEKVVDQLLASPHFGERWARHWMDLTRYAETGGHEFDYDIPHAHLYRDYLIRAFNQDISYKQFIHEHIAGDLIDTPRLHPETQTNESIVATGFWFLGEAKHAPVDSKEEEARTIDNQIDVLCKSFLGMTVACARCHNHKFDAISTEDYYALSGFLQSSRRQMAMLDPNRKIKSKFSQTARQIQTADADASQLLKQLSQADPQRFANYLNAAIDILRADISWNENLWQIIEGESLQQKSVTGGETAIQEVKPQGNFTWRGNKQYWWKNPQEGDTWELEFSTPETQAKSNRFKIDAVFTKSSDYGTVKISINDKVVVESLDFYEPTLKNTGIITLAELELQPGANQIKFECIGNDKNATPSHMVGLDYLRLIPIAENSKSGAVLLETIAEDRSLDHELLNKLVSAVQGPTANHPLHPLNLVRRVCTMDQPIDQPFAKRLSTEFETELKRHQKWETDSQLFSNFDQGLPEDWFRTGFAFGTDSMADQLTFSATGALLQAPTGISSGRFGKQYFGVIRSPTFELTHEQFHYRFRGNNVTIRLIIDGFVMDEYNALLFNGCKLGIKSAEEFTWQSQSGDIKNHLGSRAHLEIIDHGNGFIELDEIRMSNGSRPTEAPTAIKRDLAQVSFDSQASFCSALARSLISKTSLKDETGTAVATWIIENDLAAAFDSNMKVSLSQNKLSPNHVSIDSPAVRLGPIRLAKSLKTARDNLSQLNENTPHPQLAIAMTDGTGEEEFIFIRGNHKTLGKPATRRFLSAISSRPLNPPNGSGRLLLAQKITAPKNPLTSRVVVNRIWHHLYGRGIVGSTDNLGVLGKTPTHPELLDYLATEFVADGWSLKRMIKRMMLTQTYQMASTPVPEAKAIDPDNNLLHRARIRRLQGEAIRDSMLSITGHLNKKMYGPPVPIHLTPFMSGRGRPGTSGRVDGEGRRSIYISVRRNFLSPMMLAFDTPIPFNSTGTRNTSNVPAQALILMNDPFVIEQAKIWGERLVKENQPIEDRIKTIYWSALGRAPDSSEITQAQEFVQIQAKELLRSPKVNEADIQNNVQIWQDVCHIIFNLKEFIYIN